VLLSDHGRDFLYFLHQPPQAVAVLALGHQDRIVGGDNENGNEIDEKALKMAIVSLPGCTFLLIQLAALHQPAAYVGRLQRRVFGR
jgi:hypothetical protein